MLEETEDKQLIEYFYDEHYTKVFIFNGMYILQTILCSVYVITHIDYVKFTMFGMSCIFLLIELMQMIHSASDSDKENYFYDFWNWIELAGNGMVIRTAFFSDDVTWILIILLSVKGI
jgi:hypothetical protein